MPVVHVTKILDRPDGSFTIELDARFLGPGTKGGWRITDGDGAYEGLRGGGLIVGTAFGGGAGILDVYTGHVTH